MEYPKLSLETLPSTEKQFTAVVNESILRGSFKEDSDCIQNALKMLANPQYRIHNPEYTKEYIQKLVAVFTQLFLKYLEGKVYE